MKWETGIIWIQIQKKIGHAASISTEIYVVNGCSAEQCIRYNAVICFSFIFDVAPFIWFENKYLFWSVCLVHQDFLSQTYDIQMNLLGEFIDMMRRDVVKTTALLRGKIIHLTKAHLCATLWVCWIDCITMISRPVWIVQPYKICMNERRFSNQLSLASFTKCLTISNVEWYQTAHITMESDVISFWPCRRAPYAMHGMAWHGITDTCNSGQP